MPGEELNQFFASLDSEKYELLVGMETDDPLRYAFRNKRVIHAGLMGTMAEPARWHETWNLLMSQKGNRGKRTAYVHIPFCRSKCMYCGFFQSFSADEIETLYIDRLIKEFQMSHATRYCSADPVHAVFIGGGTPSALSAANICRLLQALNQYLPLANDCEITFEARIHDLVPDKIEACLENGVNRISVGVQSFDTLVRRKVGRLDKRETVLERLKRLSDYDQAAVIIDLMYGLPYQTMDIWLEDVATLKTAAIDGADLYQLNVYENSALKKAINIGALAPAATAAEQAVMFANAEAWLRENQMRRVSICHWAKTNRERNLYNALSKEGATVLPFGAGAGGNIDGVTVMLQRDLNRYLHSIDKGEKPLSFMEQAGPERDLKGLVVGQIERGYLDLNELCTRYGPQVKELEVLLRMWERRGLVTNGTYTTVLTVPGQFWHVNIAQAVLECLYRLLYRKEEYLRESPELRVGR